MNTKQDNAAIAIEPFNIMCVGVRNEYVKSLTETLKKRDNIVIFSTVRHDLEALSSKNF